MKEELKWRDVPAEFATSAIMSAFLTSFIFTVVKVIWWIFSIKLIIPFEIWMIMFIILTVLFWVEFRDSNDWG